jgi:hypothetical protein
LALFVGSAQCRNKEKLLWAYGYNDFMVA